MQVCKYSYEIYLIAKKNYFIITILLHSPVIGERRRHVKVISIDSIDEGEGEAVV